MDKVFKKNPYIKWYYSNIYALGSDNTEFVEGFYVKSYADLDQMFIKNDELLAEARESQTVKSRMDKGYARYFTGIHADNIYVAVPEFSK